MAQYGQAACALTDGDILEIIELPRFGDGEILDFSADAATAHRRALWIALNAENQARDFYTDLALNAIDPELRALYVELSSFEADHVESLERRLAGIKPNRRESNH